jgi:V8-like Glu-specific endopeptidase
MSTSTIEQTASSDSATAEATADVVESSPDLEAGGTATDEQKHSPVSGGGQGTEGFGDESGDESSGSGGGAGTTTFEESAGWDAGALTEATPSEEAAVDAYYAEVDSEEFLQFLAPLVGPLVSTVLPAAAKSLAGSVAPGLLQRLTALLGQRPRPRPVAPGAPRREAEEEAVLDEAAVAEAVEQLETVIGKDDRVRITGTRAVPWKRICHLLIEAKDGRRFTGTGWFIGPRTIATAGHCVYLHGAGGWAKSIQVVPGRDGTTEPYGRMTATRFSSVVGWVNGKDRDYDYGVIHLPRAFPASDIGSFGFANFPDDRLRSSRLNLAGYPGDKPAGTMWFHGRTAQSLTPTRIGYDIDTFGGQSGSPVWVRTTDGKRYAVGIHTNGSPRQNSATRINRQVFANLRAWSQAG